MQPSSSKNDIFSRSFRALPPSPPHSLSLNDNDDPFAAPHSPVSNLGRSRTTGQSWLRDRERNARIPPPLNMHERDKEPFVFLFPQEAPLSPPGSVEDADALRIDDADLRTPLGDGGFAAAALDFTPLAPGGGPSRTSSFFDLPSVSARLSPPHSLARSTLSSSASTASASDFSSAYSTRSNPSLMEELPANEYEDGEEQEEQVLLRLREERRYFLGEGRFAKVWVAAYRKNCGAEEYEYEDRGEDSGWENDEGVSADTDAPPRWRLCAAKQPLPDAESQLLGRREAFFLRRLARPPTHPIPADLAEGRKYIVRLLGVVRSTPQSEYEAPPLPDRPRRPALDRLASSQLTASPTILTPQTPVTPLHLRIPFLHKKSLDRLAPPTPTSAGLRHVRSVSDTLAFSPSTAPPTAQAYLPPTPPWSTPNNSLPQPERITLLLSYHPHGSLASLVHTSPHLLTPSLYTSLALQLSLALAYTHALGILHTDLKPQNILLSTSYTPRLADFGSALLLPPFSSSPPPSDGLGLGTPGYTAPELLLPPHTCTFSYEADIFSLGVVLGVLLFGREPYAGRGRGEMMRWARRGDYWGYEESVRFAGVGEEARGRKEERELGERWASASRARREAEDELLYDADSGARELLTPDRPIRSRPPRPRSAAPPTLPPSPPVSPPLCPPNESGPYADGSPPIYFLGSPSSSLARVRAPETLVSLVKRMCAPKAEARPSMEEAVVVLRAVKERFP